MLTVGFHPCFCFLVFPHGFLHFQLISGPYPMGGSTPHPHPRPPYTSNYRVPPAHRFHKYKLRILYFRIQKLTPYSIKFIKKILEEHAPRLFLVDTAPMAPPQPLLETYGWKNYNLSWLMGCGVGAGYWTNSQWRIYGVFNPPQRVFCLSV